MTLTHVVTGDMVQRVATITRRRVHRRHPTAPINDNAVGAVDAVASAAAVGKSATQSHATANTTSRPILRTAITLSTVFSARFPSALIPKEPIRNTTPRPATQTVAVLMPTSRVK